MFCLYFNLLVKILISCIVINLLMLMLYVDIHTKNLVFILGCNFYFLIFSVSFQAKYTKAPINILLKQNINSNSLITQH